MFARVVRLVLIPKGDWAYLAALFVGWILAFLLFTGRSTFGPQLLRFVPFSINLPFHRFFVHVHMMGILLAGYFVYLTGRVIVWCFKRFGLAELGRAFCVVLLVAVVLYPVAAHHYGRTVGHMRDLQAQDDDVMGWWGNASYTLMKVKCSARVLIIYYIYLYIYSRGLLIVFMIILVVLMLAQVGIGVKCLPLSSL